MGRYRSRAGRYPRGRLSHADPDRSVHLPDIQAQEREKIWLKVWQVAGRVADIPAVGDWKEYKIFDQSFVIIRGKDDRIRGFVNACRHRGNVLCTGSGNAKRGILCQYHLWSYDLDGALKGILREGAQGDIGKDNLSLVPVSVDTFAGFIFLNPDPDAAPLAEFLGEGLPELLAPYRLDEMVTVLDVRESVNCNWKVVMDAFEEGYHISGIHPELLRVIMIDPTTVRYRFFENHSVSVAPFDVANADKYSAEEQVEGIHGLPETFPTVAMVLPRFDELVGGYRSDDEPLRFPDGVTARTLLQQATRDTLTGMGLDVSRLTDAQMSDNHGWVLFPNFFMTIRAGEATTIMATPTPTVTPTSASGTSAASCGCPRNTAMCIERNRSRSRSPAASNTSWRCNRTTNRCRASSAACAATVSTSWPW